MKKALYDLNINNLPIGGVKCKCWWVRNSQDDKQQVKESQFQPDLFWDVVYEWFWCCLSGNKTHFGFWLTCISDLWIITCFPKCWNLTIDFCFRLGERQSADSGISYSDIAEKAADCGREQLAVQLLEHEVRPDKQVPLLMKLGQGPQALRFVEKFQFCFNYFDLNWVMFSWNIKSESYDCHINCHVGRWACIIYARKMHICWRDLIKVESDSAFHELVICYL